MKNIHQLRVKIVKELAKFRERTSFYREDYFGSEEQIAKETEILFELSERLDEDIVEMGDREDLVEWYERMLKETRIFVIAS
jgi:hypothetical protein